MSKVILITGCSSGVGLDLSVQLAQRGHSVYATMRNLAKQEALLSAAKAADVNLKVLQLDVQDMSSVEACVASLITDEGRIDVLINNAGAGFIRSTEQASEAEIQRVLDVNFTGVVRCTKAVLPHLRRQRSGHIINVSSVGGLVGQPFNELYCAAKFAVEGYTESLATYVQPSFNIYFTSIQPGGIATEFANNVLQEFQQTGGMLEDEYKPILEKYLGGAQRRAAAGAAADIYQSSAEVATVIADCVDMTEPPIRLRTSEWAEAFCELKTAKDPDGKKQQQAVIKAMLS